METANGNNGELSANAKQNLVNQNEVLLNNQFLVVCSKCQQPSDINSVEFVPMRKDLLSLLKSTYLGLLVEHFFETHKTLSNKMQDDLAQIIIEQELVILISKKKASITNPLTIIE